MEIKPEPDFLHKTRHDIHSAMHVVIGMSDVLAMSGTLGPSQKEIVVILRKNADRTLELIDSMFEFLLPAEMEQKEDKRNRENLTPISVVLGASDKKPYALLVEDFEADALVASRFLKKLGYDCDVAQSGEEALEKFSAGHYNVLLIDMRMPGMGGLETTQRIRAFEKKKNMEPTLIIATTGNTNEADRLLCAKAGMNGFLSKPFGLKDLEGKLRSRTLHETTSI